MKYVTKSEADTMKFAGVLSGMLEKGDSILLHGDLGAGKSVFARGVARGLEISGPMPSPTFTLLIPYEGKRKLYHFDLYRLNDPDEFYAAGLDEFIGGDGVALIEWPEMAEIDPVPRLDVKILRDDGGDDVNVRIIEIENEGVLGFDEAALDEWRMEG